MKCIIDGCEREAVSRYEEKPAQICDKCWQGLPLKVRQAIWRETDYGAAIAALVAALKPFANIQPSSFCPPDGSESEGYAAYLTDRLSAIDFTGKDIANARELLTRMGVKL